GDASRSRSSIRWPRAGEGSGAPCTWRFSSSRMAESALSRSRARRRTRCSTRRRSRRCGVLRPSLSPPVCCRGCCGCGCRWSSICSSMLSVRTIERDLDGTTTEYHDMAVEGDGVERLLTEPVTDHWAKLTVGPLIEGAAYEIQFVSAPKVTTLDGYLTVDTGPWHFHLCVNDQRGARTDELARIRRVARAAFFRTEGASCVG